MRKTSKKALNACQVKQLEDIPNIGPAAVKDLLLLGIKSSQELVTANAFELYNQLCKKTNMRHDPCVIDVFMSAIRFMQGEEPKPWWTYTAERKRIISNAH
jgi:hypothetical protein